MSAVLARRLSLALPLMSWGALSCSAPALAACERLLPEIAAPMTVGQKRRVTPEDLVGLRDIGATDVSYAIGDSPLAVSPDGKRLAFVITQGDAAANRHCRALVVLDLVQGAEPHVIDSGGEFMTMMNPTRGSLIATGAPEVVTPMWSPDGQSLAFRKRIDGRTEAWIASADGSGARRIARLEVDVEALAWSADGARLVLASRPGLAAQARGLDREGLTGYLYDARVSPNESARPLLAVGEPLVFRTIDIASQALGDAGADDVLRVPPVLDPTRVWSPVIVSAEGLSARLVSDDKPGGPMRISIFGTPAGTGASPVCLAEHCTGSIRSLLWLGDQLFYLRREGWAWETTVLYAWRPDRGQPRRVMATTDAVHGCVPAQRRILCLVETATTPRRIVSIDAASGARSPVYDPNPEFAGIALGEVKRLKFRNQFGIEAWGDLALPPGYAGGRLPLVVVQYNSRGFLRGGTGDDYPVHAFAARGFAVLSFERPAAAGTHRRDRAVGTPASGESVNRPNVEGWVDRRSLLGAVEGLVAQAIELGVADPRRIGITGLSDGATTSAFALVNSRTFAAAAISSCCTEPNTVMVQSGPARARQLLLDGFPPLGPGDADFWQPMSVSRNADRIAAPILMQLADREYLLGLETWAALKQAGKPVEMYVYPDEYHNRWQPVHRLATYVRSLDWFDYWLAGKRDADPAKAAQYERWDALRRLRDAGADHAAANPARPDMD
ncbi:Atxe2 family lasso peptide isopeptidase [Novosphingobium sp. JCM 18896]|uniref:Atxe2 family lasso peptide isopeptidase n=1 Tax=Novosphingobium sp. JCM 18896 TaxID=2989731 RepID=UPI00222374BC|nr:Atxe2 family lasso peptide isopeptidase [Novosphingobium sp. JCM 18896]MCW1430884.1 Atxe2 family lasso peptide isopeptidase [Novosphingobium sp. JCM 18896]